MTPHSLVPGFEHDYSDLRELAAAYLRRFADAPTLQATALVHEAYLRLARQPRSCARHDQCICAAAQAMRWILVDHARARQRARGDGDALRVTLSGLEAALPEEIDVLILNDALERLRGWDPRQANIVELRFFAGLSVPETAAALDVSEKTVKRDWAMARAWLQGELRGPTRPPGERAAP